MFKVKAFVSLSFLLFFFSTITLAQKASKNMVPVLNAISPSSTTAGGASLTLTVTGSNFTSGSVVRWNGSSLTTTVVNSTQLQAVVGSSLVADAGAARITVFTSGRWGGTSNSLTLTINPAPAAAPPPPPPPPPSPDPLTITTSSVPAGNAGSTYNASLAASGGTPAYIWKRGDGTLPPGLALQANGALTGTPTQGGTFTFTAEADDQAGQVAQRAFSLSVTAPPPPPPPPAGSGTLFQTGFEPADPAMDGINAPPDTAITSTPPPGRRGNALQMHYTICGDSTNVACGASSQDINRWASKVISPGLTHFFMRGYVYFKSPEPGATTGTIMQRKVMWFSDDTSPGGSRHPGPDLILNTWTGADGLPIKQLSLTVTENASACTGTITNVWDIARLDWDTWYSIENEIQLNSSGVADGVWRIWVNGNKVWDGTGLNLIGSCGTSISFFSVGRQTDRARYDVVDEYRYWDDVVISQSYIGP